MPLKNADITAALSGGSAVKLSDGHSLYFVTNGRGAGSWVYEYRDAGRLRAKGLAPAAGGLPGRSAQRHLADDRQPADCPHTHGRGRPWDRERARVSPASCRG